MIVFCLNKVCSSLFLSSVSTFSCASPGTVWNWDYLWEQIYFISFARIANHFISSNWKRDLFINNDTLFTLNGTTLDKIMKNQVSKTLQFLCLAFGTMRNGPNQIHLWCIKCWVKSLSNNFIAFWVKQNTVALQAEPLTVSFFKQQMVKWLF